MGKSAKFLVVFFVLITLTFSLSPSSFSSVALAKEKLSFPTAATTGALYPLGAGIANLWNTKLDYLSVKVQASNGGIQNLNLLLSKDAQISFAVSSISYEALNGLASFEGRAYKDLRVIAGLYINPNQVVVRKSANINTISDLKGKRFAPGAAGSTTEVETNIHFKTVGLDYPKDIQAHFVGFTEAIDLMRNKQIDGVWIMGGTPTAAVSEMLSTTDAKLLSLEPELIQNLQSQYPWYSPVTIPANTYENQSEDVLTSGIKLLLLTDASLSAQTVYDLTKCFWENLDELVSAHSVIKQVDINLATKDLASLPLHEGAAQYYKEIGQL